MPKRKKQFRSRRRKRRKISRKVVRRTMIPRLKRTPFTSKRWRTRLTYATFANNQAATATNPATAVNSYRLNGCFDPEVALGGHQPWGFDRMMQTYNHFTVVGCRYEIFFHQTTANPNEVHDIVCCTEVSGQSASLALASSLGAVEAPQIRTRQLVPYLMDKRYVVMKGYVNMSKFLSQNVLSEDANAGSDSADPTEQVFLHVFALANQNSGGATRTYDIKVKLVYDVVFHEPKNLDLAS